MYGQVRAAIYVKALNEQIAKLEAAKLKERLINDGCVLAHNSAAYDTNLELNNLFKVVQRDSTKEFKVLYVSHDLNQKTDLYFSLIDRLYSSGVSVILCN